MWNDMVNKHRPHVFVLPEDDANRQLANGFVLDASLRFPRQIFVLPVAGGWTQVLERFLSDEAVDMQNCPDRYMVLLLDFDNDPQRLDTARNRIPVHLSERVFILGVWSEPERLKEALGPYEEIGSALAQDCRDEASATWDHLLLRHNGEELARLRERVRPILF
jgi:hypothetical protein